MSKRNRQYNRYRGMVIGLVAVVCFLAFAWNGYKNSGYAPGDSVSGTQQTGRSVQESPALVTATVTDNTGLLNRQQVELLEKYAIAYGTTLQTMEPQDISALYADKDSRAYHLNRTALQVLTSIRGMRDIDLTLEYAQVEYVVQEVSGSGNVTVTLLENNTQKFRHLSEPSLSANLYHKFVLTQVDGNWLIKSHEHEEDFYLLTAEGWDDATGATNGLKAASALEIILGDARENLADMGQFQLGEHTDVSAKDTSYNRDRAVDYAQQWWNTRNYTGSYLAYDDYGGNCQNFASQCLFAGGLDMDYNSRYGEWQWKFYSATLNNKAGASGRSYSWTGVDPFYTYVTSNDSTGIVAQADIPYEYAEKGDVIHVGAYYQWRHALLITDVLKNRDGTLQDIVVASNTADRWNYPLSAYIYTAPRLIHIVGQN